MKRWHGVMLVVSALVALAAVASEEPAERVLGPAVQAIQRAAIVKEPAEREQALREGIRAGLLSADPEVRREVFSYLCRMSDRWLDLRPYTDLLEQYAAVPGEGGRGLRLADDVELFRAPREERIELYRRAIVEGKVLLKRGTPLDRWNAVRGAAWQGLDELRPLIETYYPLTPGLAADTPIEQLRLWLDLRAGAIDREDALRLASQRLAKLEDREFESRMDGDPIFKQTVLQNAQDACALNPFTGERNPACASLYEIAKKQKERHAQREAQARAAGAERPPRGIGGPGTWLEQLEDMSRPVRVIPPDQLEEVRRTRRLPPRT